MVNLNKGEFKSAELVEVYSRPNLHSVMLGNKVELRSGGPCMIVEDSWLNEEGFTTARVKWKSIDDKLKTSEFDLRMLTCFGAVK